MAYPHKWSPTSCKSSAGQRKDTGQRPMLYRWTTQPTKEMSGDHDRVRTGEERVRIKRRVIHVVDVVVVNVVVGVERCRRRRCRRRRREILFVQTFARWRRRRTLNPGVPFTHAYHATITYACWRRGVVVIVVRRMGGYTITVLNQPTRSTQPRIPLGLLNRVSASAGVKAGMSPLPGGR